jgi:hypothetical protein
MASKLQRDLALAGFGINEAMLKGQGIGVRTIKALGNAAVKLSPYVARGAATTAPIVGRTAASLAAANPVSTGLGLGLAATQTPSGQALLEAAAERGRMDRIALEQAIDERIFAATKVAESPTFRGQVKSAARRKVSKYQKAVKAGMAAVKKSKFDGKRGQIKDAKRTFATVNKVASAVNKGRKVTTKGVKGVIKRAIGKIL